MDEQQIMQKENETEIDLLRIGRMLLKYAWLIVAVAMVFGVAAYVYSACFIAPTYRAGFTAYANSQVGTGEISDISTSHLNASIGLAKVCSKIVTSRSVLLDAAQIGGYNMSYGQLRSKVSISVSSDTAIISIYVSDTDPVRATRLAEGIAEAAPYHIERVVDGGSLRVLDAPIQPQNRYSPSYSRNAVLGAVIGAILTVIVLVINELVNDKVQNPQELESRYQITVIGNIPDMIHVKKDHDKYGYRKAGNQRK